MKKNKKTVYTKEPMGDAERVADFPPPPAALAEAAEQKDALLTKEHQLVEWKATWRDDYLRWVCGFANADGGVLVIGRDDEGRAVGVAQAARLLEEIPNKVRDVLGIMVDVNLRQEDGHELLEIHVEPYPSPVSYKGEYHYRSGSTKQELRGAALSHFLLKKQGLHWDAMPLLSAQWTDLDTKVLQQFRKLALRSQRLSAEMLQEPNDSLLDKLHLTAAEGLKRAAVLLFHPDPERFVGGAWLKIGFFESNADLRYQDEVHGDLLSQVGKAIDILKAKYLKAWITYDGLQRVESYPLPEPALREALINAVVHKDYASGLPIQISVYPNKLMVWNSAQQPQPWTAQQLLAKHASIPVNPDVAGIFFRAGMIESWGRGIERMVQACHQAGLEDPVFAPEAGGFWVTFRFGPQWAVGGVTGSATGSATGSMPEKIRGNPVFRLVWTVGKAELAPSEIQQRLGLLHRPTFRENYLRPALQQRLLEMTLPDKPASRLQRYRLTDTGKLLLLRLQQDVS
jgi:ATP-dependent DNA helicase RecG